MMTKNEFIKETNNIVVTALNNANKFLSRFNLSVEINWEYEFDDEGCIGIYEGGSVFEGVISIGFNMNSLYRTVCDLIKEYPYTSPYTMLDETIFTNVYHEVGHGLVELINDYLTETDELDSLYDNNQQLFDWVLDNEEDAVEEFAWCFYDNDLISSRLYKMLKLYLNLYKVNESILTESQGVSDEVSAMSERIMQGILGKADSIGWNDDQRFVNQDGETMKSKIFRLDTRSLGLQQYANDIMVYLFGFDENEIDITAFFEYLKGQGYLGNNFTQNGKFLYFCLPWPYGGYRALSRKWQGVILGAINHEFMHAFHDDKENGYEISNAYMKASKDWGSDYVISLAKQAYYAFDKEEMYAHIQQLWTELQYVDELEDCRAYKTIQNYLNFLYPTVMDWFNNPYQGQDIKDKATQFITEQMGITVNQYLKTIQKNYKKYLTAFNRVIGRWQQNHLQSSQNSSNAGETTKDGKKNNFWKNAIGDILKWIKS